MNEKIYCPKCGTEFTISGDSKPKSNIQQRIDALKNAGVDVGNLFAMQAANGTEYIAENDNGNISILDKSDELYQKIMSGGTICNHHLFRRWVMSQLYRMLAREENHGFSVTKSIRDKGYMYQWKMVRNELCAQSKISCRNYSDFIERNRWFNKEVVISMVNDYITQLTKHLQAAHIYRCKGISYIKIGQTDIFTSDVKTKVLAPLDKKLDKIKDSHTPTQLSIAVADFIRRMPKINYNSFKQSDVWLDAYKGAGAYYTLQNMIRFHNCYLFDKNTRLDKYESLTLLSSKAKEYKGYGWCMLGLLKETIKRNNIDIDKKRAEWLKKK